MRLDLGGSDSEDSMSEIAEANPSSKIRAIPSSAQSAIQTSNSSIY